MRNFEVELKPIFDFLLTNPNSSARQIGKAVEGGKSRANHFLYGYQEILFTKRGLTPPLWQVASKDSYRKMIERLSPTPIVKSQANYLELVPITVCSAYDLPIKPNGLCGCS